MASKYQFLIIQPFELAKGDAMNDRYHSNELPKEQRVRADFIPGVRELLADVDWDFHGGPTPCYGNWAPENREELAYLGAERIKIVREACKSGKYNAIVLLGGAEPGFFEAREVSQEFKIPITSCAHSQMHIATMIGHKFSVIDFPENHNRMYYDIVIRHGMSHRCASIRNLDVWHMRPGQEGLIVDQERDKALRGEPSEAVERAAKAAVSAITEDGAEVITFGCSDCFWLKPFLKKRLLELGWDIPILDGYTAAIGLARFYVDMGLNVSSLMYPVDMPKVSRMKKVF